MSNRYEALNEDDNWRRILEIVGEAYPDALIAQIWEDFLAGEETSAGDTLAEFIVRELADTFDAEASPKKQLETAVVNMVNAKNDVRDVYEALYVRWISTPEGEDSAPGSVR